jgi:poly(A) polymerase
MTNPEACRAFSIDVVKRLRGAGYQALWAGGCVRDLLLQQMPTDYDVATDALPEQVTNLFRRTCSVGISFGVVRVIGPPGTSDVEVATFRSDGTYVDGRRPDSVCYGTPQADAARRDFTINGMFMDPLTGEVIDYVGGQADLAARILRAIGNPRERFAEDKLRLLRAVRFAARFHLEIEPNTRAALLQMAPEVRAVAAERIAGELRRMLVDPSRAEAMQLALDTGMLAAVLPPVVHMKGLFQGKPVQPQGDLWDHTLLVLKNLPPAPSFTLAFAALLHDVGKPATRALQDGKYTYHNHEQMGSRIAAELCQELRLSNAERERIVWLVEYHQYLGEAKKLREAKLKRVLATPWIEELLALHRADALASTGDTSNVDYCEYYLRAQPTGPINPPPLLTGHDLVRHGLKPGPNFKKILDAVREAQLDRSVNNKREALDWVDQKVAAGQLLGRLITMGGSEGTDHQG